MKGREFIALVCGARVVWPLPGHAQQMEARTWLVRGSLEVQVRPLPADYWHKAGVFRSSSHLVDAEITGGYSSASSANGTAGVHSSEVRRC